MASQVLPQKKKPGPAPTGQGTPVMVRLHEELLDPLDDWIDVQPDPKPSRPKAIRILLRTILSESPAAD